MQIESLILNTPTSSLDIFQLLKASHELLPDELSSASLEVQYEGKETYVLPALNSLTDTLSFSN